MGGSAGELVPGGVEVSLGMLRLSMTVAGGVSASSVTLCGSAESLLSRAAILYIITPMECPATEDGSDRWRTYLHLNSVTIPTRAYRATPRRLPVPEPRAAAASTSSRLRAVVEMLALQEFRWLR
jgi:hypothetical protein